MTARSQSFPVDGISIGRVHSTHRAAIANQVEAIFMEDG